MPPAMLRSADGRQQQRVIRNSLTHVYKAFETSSDAERKGRLPTWTLLGSATSTTTNLMPLLASQTPCEALRESR